MSAENLFEHLSYLESAIASLEQAFLQKEAENKDLSIRLANAEMSIVAFRKESEDFANKVSRDAQKYVEAEVASRVNATMAAERLAMKEELDEARRQLATAQATAAKVTKKKADPQADLFAQSWGAPSAPARIANDQSALILAGKLDSTIDKVQRLLREAGA